MPKEVSFGKFWEEAAMCLENLSARVEKEPLITVYELLPASVKRVVLVSGDFGKLVAKPFGGEDDSDRGHYNIEDSILSHSRSGERVIGFRVIKARRFDIDGIVVREEKPIGVRTGWVRYGEGTKVQFYTPKEAKAIEDGETTVWELAVRSKYGIDDPDRVVKASDDNFYSAGKYDIILRVDLHM